ncbi:DUF58 domain-containing protein [Aurantiacibacter poecillastricola]|uniref:DUF58 domain-containing protein n=1 Tax=Aurantiacibacter poecillastricola TaxID=3064385 RepID=UPI00273F3936|nr:DUF58 domain-containing protein [Aurantiacibacter sp. 219JJ12-13]MDP5261090.1 DUF58 domain-containing protein [Aurantiacibacter sp. 219JJ12-13]
MNALSALLARLPTIPIVPTARTLVLLTLLAPVAVVIAATAPSAWIVAPAAALTLLLLALLDGWMAGRLLSLDYFVPSDAEVGQPCAIRVEAAMDRDGDAALPEAAIGFEARLGERGTARFELEPAGEAGKFAGAGKAVPVRRGPGELHDLWLRWTGPLGLAARQEHVALDARIRVWPDLSPVRSPTLQAFLRDSQFGLVARRIRGEGTQFEALSEYEPGMDRRRIDWKASARHTALYARENEAERDNQIVFAFDCGQSMIEPVDGLPRIDRAVSAALMAAYVALKGGDRVSLFGFADKPQVMTPFINDTRAFHRLQSAAANLDYTAREPNFTLALATLTARLKRRSLIVLFSDFADPTSAQLMVESVERLLRHHLVIFVTMVDTELEDLSATEPETMGDIAVAVGADSLARQRQLVLTRLKRLGVNVIEARHDAIGYRLIDLYLETKRAEAIG